jgi:hypothetical protein
MGLRLGLTLLGLILLRPLLLLGLLHALLRLLLCRSLLLGALLRRIGWTRLLLLLWLGLPRLLRLLSALGLLTGLRLLNLALRFLPRLRLLCLALRLRPRLRPLRLLRLPLLLLRRRSVLLRCAVAWLGGRLPLIALPLFVLRKHGYRRSEKQEDGGRTRYSCEFHDVGSCRLLRRHADHQVSRAPAKRRLACAVQSSQSIQMRTFLPIAMVGIIFSVAGMAQVPEPSRWQIKLRFHAEHAYGPWQLVVAVAGAGYLQKTNSPREWGQGWNAYGERLGSTLAYSGVRNTIGFGLDTMLREDPRYYRSTDRGFWRRTGHVVRGTFLTRTDSGGETLSIWRIGSAYGAAFISNEWRPDSVDTKKLSVEQGSVHIGADLLQNFGSEFWPDIRRKIRHHDP